MKNEYIHKNDYATAVGDWIVEKGSYGYTLVSCSYDTYRAMAVMQKLSEQTSEIRE